jgi:hypothetical protein
MSTMPKGKTGGASIAAARAVYLLELARGRSLRWPLNPIHRQKSQGGYVLAQRIC